MLNGSALFLWGPPPPPPRAFYVSLMTGFPARKEARVKGKVGSLKQSYAVTGVLWLSWIHAIFQSDTSFHGERLRCTAGSMRWSKTQRESPFLFVSPGPVSVSHSLNSLQVLVDAHSKSEKLIFTSWSGRGWIPTRSPLSRVSITVGVPK